MLTCKSCLRAYVRAALETTPYVTGQKSRLPTSRHNRFARHYATNVGVVSQPKTSQLSGAAIPVSSGDVSSKRRLEKELAYLRDPLKLATYTTQLLNRNEREKALEIIRQAGKNGPCTVSWNHIIDHDMSLGKVKSAISVFNEASWTHSLTHKLLYLDR